MKHVSLSRQRDLLRMEYEFEKAAFRREAEAMGLDRKARRGECWRSVGLGRSYYNSLDRLVVEVNRTEETDIEHEFEYGRSVCFFTEDGSGGIRYLDFTATVSHARESSMAVVLPGEEALAALQRAERLGVQLHFDETTYRLMFDALDRVIAAKDDRVATLRDLFHTDAPLARPAATGHVGLPWLNAAQEAAVNAILAAREVSIVHGPPGTGKTTTLVEAVCEVLRREPQVLVCAQSNTAVDWISEQLADRGVPVLRVGNPTRVTEKMLSCTYERRFEAHPDYPSLWAVRRAIRQLYSLPRKGRGESFHQKIARLREKADELELRIRHALFDGARVVAATLAGSGQPLLAGRHFHTLFIDEAAQALEAACWIALQRADRVVLAGDHCQLPPTVKCMEAARGGLAVTLMEQLAERKPECVHLLTMQYRMNETLMAFPSRWFYGGRLTAAPTVKRRTLLDEIDDPIVWIDTSELPGDESGGGDFREQFAGRSYGRVNRAEARLTLDALRRYAERVGRRRLAEERVEIAVISPYRAQVQYLRGLLRKDDYLRPLLPQIAVNTVDAFQGRERDIVLVSLVRANENGEIGFLSDLRRMNVAMTRARTKLILIGNAETLCRHRFYKALFDYCQAARGDR